MFDPYLPDDFSDETLEPKPVIIENRKCIIKKPKGIYEIIRTNRQN